MQELFLYIFFQFISHYSRRSPTVFAREMMSIRTNYACYPKFHIRIGIVHSQIKEFVQRSAEFDLECDISIDFLL
jgi:hypothetical protein